MSPISVQPLPPEAVHVPPAPTPAAEVAYLPCEICGVSRNDVLFHLADSLDARRRGATFVRCRGCGLISRNPRPWAFEQVRTLSPAGSLAERPRALLSAAVPWIRSLTGLNVLFLGCGATPLIKRLARRGFRTMAVDPDPEAVDAAFDGEAVKPPVHRRDLASLALPDETFSGAVVVDALTCVPHPAQTLMELHRLLKTGGTCLLTVPNASSLAFELFGSRWRPLAPEQTLFHYTPETLTILVEETGFVLKEIVQRPEGSHWADALLDGALRRASRAPFLRFAARPLARTVAACAARLAAWWGRGDRIVALLEKH